MSSVYRVYLRTVDGVVPTESKTMTGNPDAALRAFAALVNDTTLDGQPLAAVLSFNNQQLAFHRFDYPDEATDYWRGKLGKIRWPDGYQREGDDPIGSPQPSDVRAAREAAGLTQTEAAELIHCDRGTWAKWEGGTRLMHPAFWELFRIKTARSRA